MRNFQYVVTRTDPVNMVMDVFYWTDDYEPILVGVRLPAIDQTLEDVCLLAAPHGHWDALDDLKRHRWVPDVGDGGSFQAPAIAAADPVPEIILAKREVTL